MSQVRVPGPQLHAVLVTFRRPRALAHMLAALSDQTVALHHLVVVDNAPSPETAAVVHAGTPRAKYLASPENLGPAGGLRRGLEAVLPDADDDDWVVFLDDDDPPHEPGILMILFEFAQARRAQDPATGGVGISGVRFDRRRGRMVRVDDQELRGGVSVDCIGGNQLPTYAVKAIRAVGPPRRELFFGLEELELGLRLRDRGFTLYGHGPSWHASRARGGRLSSRFAPARSLAAPTWRRYYSLRNLIYILRERGDTGAAVRVTLTAGIAKPLINLPVQPGLAQRNLRQNARACLDAWTNRLGRRIDPPIGPAGTSTTPASPG